VDLTPHTARPAPGDDPLTSRLLAGDEAAFAEVVDAWSGGMRRLAAAYVGPAWADDVVQDAWLAVIEHLASFQGRSSLRHWVYRIVVNTAKRRAARDSRIVPVEDPTGEAGPAVEPSRFRGRAGPFPGHWQELPAPWPTPEEATDAAEVRRAVAEAVRRLPPRQAAMVTLRDIDGYGPDEAAELMGVSAANQRVLLHRGRAGVRAALEEYLTSGVTDRVPRDSGGHGRHRAR
jgi:RNA polymerase sigma-70 factor (ECF subfamily)